MSARKRKKNSRQRGNKWHSWGRGHAHHKGAGNKGGVGMAGTGKRADTKKPSIWKEDYFGSKGFVPQRKVLITGLNIASIEEQYLHFVKLGAITEEGSMSVVDLSKLNADKLLSCGTPSRKYKILAKYASKKAVEKISAAKGEVVVENASKEQASEE